jgi:thiol:disulfide interchange protein
MSIYYFGYSSWLYTAIFLLLTALGGFLLWKSNSNKPKLYASFAMFALAAIALFVSVDLRTSISDRDASQLQAALDDSLTYPLSGAKLQDAVSALAREKGVLVDSNTSYIGKDIYLTYISLDDFNKLAKIYKEIQNEGL